MLRLSKKFEALAQYNKFGIIRTYILIKTNSMNRTENMNPPAIEIPEDLLWALNADANTKAAFDQITIPHRQVYINLRAGASTCYTGAPFTGSPAHDS